MWAFSWIPPCCCFAGMFFCAWADNQVAIRRKPNRPLSSLMITDQGLAGYDWETEKDLNMNWSQITSLKVKFYKVTKDTKCWKCTNTEKIRDEARKNGTAHSYSRSRSRKKRGYNIDIFDEAGGGIYSDDHLSLSFGFGLGIPCYLLHLAIIPSQDFNCVEIKGVYNNQRTVNSETRKFKFRLHGIKVQQEDTAQKYNSDMMVSSSSIDIHHLLNDATISSENVEQYFINLLETKQRLFMQRYQ